MFSLPATYDSQPSCSFSGVCASSFTPYCTPAPAAAGTKRSRLDAAWEPTGIPDFAVCDDASDSWGGEECAKRHKATSPTFSFEPSLCTPFAPSAQCTTAGHPQGPASSSTTFLASNLSVDSGDSPAVDSTAPAPAPAPAPGLPRLTRVSSAPELWQAFSSQSNYGFSDDMSC